MNELSLANEILCGTTSDAQEILSRVDVVLCAAPIFRQIVRTAPPGLPVFNVFDRVDPVSLMAVQERIMARVSARWSPRQPVEQGVKDKL
jgi:hypothetical protein